MKIKLNSIFLFLLLPVCAAAAAQGEVAGENNLSSDFYQNFISAAWEQKNGDPKTALELYIKLDEQKPKDPAILKSIIDLAVDAENTEVMDKYVPILMEVAPDAASTVSLYATWLWSKGRFNEALSSYEKAIEKDPENPETIFKYITLLTSIDSDKAVAFLKEISKKYPKMSGLISLQIADLYITHNDYDGAIEYLKQAQQKTPFMPEPYLALAKIYESKGQTDEALAQYLKLEDAGLADADTLTKIGAYYVLKRDKPLSIEYFLKAKKLDNSNPSAAQFLVLDAEAKLNYSQALSYLKDSRDFDKLPSYSIRAAYFLTKLEDRDGAREMLKKAYDKFPYDMETSLYYTYALIDVEDYKTARKVIEGVLKTAPQNETALYQYAFILERQKKYGKMEKVLRQVLTINPDHANALNFLGYYLVDKTKKTEEGGKYIKKAVSLEPQDTASIDSLAWYYYKSGDKEKALNLLTGIGDDAKADSEILLHLAVVYEAFSDNAKAAQYYKEVLALDAQNKQAQKGLRRAEKKIK